MALSRREILSLAAAVPLTGAAPLFGQGRTPVRALNRQEVADAPGFAVGADGTRPTSVDLVREWSSGICRSRVVNRGSEPVRLKEVVLFDLELALPPETALHGEGFQMLSQTAGTLGEPVNLSQYTDEKHYRIPTAGRAFYGLLMLTPPPARQARGALSQSKSDEATRVLAFTSCARFAGRFQQQGSSMQVVVDLEGLEVRAGETVALEEFMFASGATQTKMLSAMAARLAQHHPPLKFPTPPAGWCSWYHFGPRVTAQDVLANLDVIAKSIPALKYIQIDDGYQPAMGDWLETGTAFGGNVQNVLQDIRKRGFEPAIWVAPFIAEEGSHLFQQHRDWFVKDETGQPLRADTVTFGGWRRGPWYALDGTHPDAQQHLTNVFQTMRKEWGCTYFKLDANFWGAIHGGRFHDARATRIEAYRRGMKAVRQGSGDAFILGCNHPIWASIGEVHGSRSSNDIRRTWDRVMTTARQNLNRNWQNGRFWWNDPDAVCLSDMTESEVQFHATAIFATGGMILSGDDLTQLPPARMAMMRKLLPPTGVAAEFEDASLRVGMVNLSQVPMICLFNWEDGPHTLSFALPRPATLTDYWSGESLGRKQGTVTMTLPGRSARLLRAG